MGTSSILGAIVGCNVGIVLITIVTSEGEEIDPFLFLLMVVGTLIGALCAPIVAEVKFLRVCPYVMSARNASSLAATGRVFERIASFVTSIAIRINRRFIDGVKQDVQKVLVKPQRNGETRARRESTFGEKFSWAGVLDDTASPAPRDADADDEGPEEELQPPDLSSYEQELVTTSILGVVFDSTGECVRLESLRDNECPSSADVLERSVFTNVGEYDGITGIVGGMPASQEEADDPERLSYNRLLQRLHRMGGISWMLDPRSFGATSDKAAEHDGNIIVPSLTRPTDAEVATRFLLESSCVRSEIALLLAHDIWALAFTKFPDSLPVYNAYSHFLMYHCRDARVATSIQNGTLDDPEVASALSGGKLDRASSRLLSLEVGITASMTTGLALEDETGGSGRDLLQRASALHDEALHSQLELWTLVQAVRRPAGNRGDTTRDADATNIPLLHDAAVRAVHAADSAYTQLCQALGRSQSLAWYSYADFLFHVCRDDSAALDALCRGDALDGGELSSLLASTHKVAQGTGDDEHDHGGYNSRRVQSIQVALERAIGNANSSATNVKLPKPSAWVAPRLLAIGIGVPMPEQGSTTQKPKFLGRSDRTKDELDTTARVTNAASATSRVVLLFLAVLSITFFTIYVPYLIHTAASDFSTDITSLHVRMSSMYELAGIVSRLRSASDADAILMMARLQLKADKADNERNNLFLRESPTLDHYGDNIVRVLSTGSFTAVADLGGFAVPRTWTTLGFSIHDSEQTITQSARAIASSLETVAIIRNSSLLARPGNEFTARRYWQVAGGAPIVADRLLDGIPYLMRRFDMVHTAISTGVLVVCMGTFAFIFLLVRSGWGYVVNGIVYLRGQIFSSYLALPTLRATLEHARLEGLLRGRTSGSGATPYASLGVSKPSLAGTEELDPKRQAVLKAKINEVRGSLRRLLMVVLIIFLAILLVVLIPACVNIFTALFNGMATVHSGEAYSGFMAVSPDGFSTDSGLSGYVSIWLPLSASVRNVIAVGTGAQLFAETRKTEDLKRVYSGMATRGASTLSLVSALDRALLTKHSSIPDLVSSMDALMIMSGISVQVSSYVPGADAIPAHREYAHAALANAGSLAADPFFPATLGSISYNVSTWGGTYWTSIKNPPNLSAQPWTSKTCALSDSTTDSVAGNVEDKAKCAVYGASLTDQAMKFLTLSKALTKKASDQATVSVDESTTWLSSSTRRSLLFTLTAAIVLVLIATYANHRVSARVSRKRSNTEVVIILGVVLLCSVVVGWQLVKFTDEARPFQGLKSLEGGLLALGKASDGLPEAAGRLALILPRFAQYADGDSAGQVENAMYSVSATKSVADVTQAYSREIYVAYQQFCNSSTPYGFELRCSKMQPYVDALNTTTKAFDHAAGVVARCAGTAMTSGASGLLSLLSAHSWDASSAVDPVINHDRSDLRLINRLGTVDASSFYTDSATDLADGPTALATAQRVVQSGVLADLALDITDYVSSIREELGVTLSEAAATTAHSREFAYSMYSDVIVPLVMVIISLAVLVSGSYLSQAFSLLGRASDAMLRPSVELELFDSLGGHASHRRRRDLVVKSGQTDEIQGGAQSIPGLSRVRILISSLAVGCALVVGVGFVLIGGALHDVGTAVSALSGAVQARSQLSKVSAAVASVGDALDPPHSVLRDLDSAAGSLTSILTRASFGGGSMLHERSLGDNTGLPYSQGLAVPSLRQLNPENELLTIDLSVYNKTAPLPASFNTTTSESQLSALLGSAASSAGRVIVYTRRLATQLRAAILLEGIETANENLLSNSPELANLLATLDEGEVAWDAVVDELQDTLSTAHWKVVQYAGFLAGTAGVLMSMLSVVSQKNIQAVLHIESVKLRMFFVLLRRLKT